MEKLSINFAGAFVPVTQGKIDIPLSEFARTYKNNGFVGNLIFPDTPVGRQTNKYWLFGRENQQLSENVLRAPGSPAEQIKQTMSTDSYSCPDHALARLIPDEERGNFDAAIQVEQWSLQTLMEKINLDMENRIATAATSTANYASGNYTTLSGSSQWSDAGSTPVDDIETGKSQVRLAGVEANTLILPDAVAKVLRTHPQITDRFKYSKAGAIGLADLASVFDVEKVVLASAVKVDPSTLAASFVWGKDVVLAYTNPTASYADVSFGKRFIWKDAPGTVGGYKVTLGRVSPPSAESDEQAVHSYYGLKVTSNVSAYLIKAAVA